MNCSEIQERLSSYHDGELSSDVAGQVTAHFAGCSTCAKELTSFEQLSELSCQLVDPQVPNHLWVELQSKLGGSTVPKNSLPADQPASFATASFAKNLPISGRLFALAATVLIACGIGTIAYQAWYSVEYEHLAINFANYLEKFPEQPDVAQQLLLAKYDGQPITLTEATKRLGYEPLAAKGLPPGYSVAEVHLLKMPCCTCAQILCINEAGNTVAIFEHVVDQPVWFGDRPTEDCICHGVPTSIRRAGGRLAATWKEGKRHITLIGATDLEEVAEFIGHFKGVGSG
ncbi:MAG: hypothetical protein GXP24_02715 [Planctomycetes bacterium]|nr:hypothetical protein [Planctomycetota bacterium]